MGFVFQFLHSRTYASRCSFLPLPSSPLPHTLSHLISATWRTCKIEGACKQPKLETLLAEYAEPAKVDKLMKLDKQLLETKDILVKTIDKVLQRGEKLDELVEKSNGLSAQSKQFYKAAKKTNSCCIVM